MTVVELDRLIRDVCQGAEIGEDDEGQIVVYTDLREDARGDLISHSAYMEEEEENGAV